jgi:hypothetical protein
VAVEQLEDAADRDVRVELLAPVSPVAHVVDELLALAKPVRDRGGLPAFVVDAPDEGGHLGSPSGRACGRSAHRATKAA